MITGVDAYIADRRKSFRFPRDIEAVFDEQRRGYRAKAMLSSVAPSIVCYNAFLPADWLLMPATARLATFEHAAVTGWFLVAALLFRSRPAFVVRELICVSMPILMVLQVLSIYVLGRAQPGASDYQYLAVMIVVYMNVNLRPDFRFALGSSLFLCSAYIAVLTTGHAAFSTEVVGIATMLAAVHLTLVANWRLERGRAPFVPSAAAGPPASGTRRGRGGSRSSHRALQSTPSRRVRGRSLAGCGADNADGGPDDRRRSLQGLQRPLRPPRG